MGRCKTVIPARKKREPKGSLFSWLLGSGAVEIRQKLPLRDVEDAAKASEFVIFYKPLVLFNLADQRLTDVNTQQLHLCSQILLREIAISAQSPQPRPNEIGIFIKT